MSRDSDNFVEPGCENHSRTMEIFDRLPPAARAAIRDSLEDWCPGCLLKGLKSPAYMRNRLRVWDKEELWQRRFDRMQATGPYRGNAPTRLDDLIEVDRQWNFPTPKRRRGTSPTKQNS